MGQLRLDGDQRLFTIVVALAGFLGGLIHSARFALLVHPATRPPSARCCRHRPRPAALVGARRPGADPRRAAGGAAGTEPGSGPVGTTVTVSGRNLDGAANVIFRGATASPSGGIGRLGQSVVTARAATGPVRLEVGSSLVSVPGEFRVE